MMNNFSTLTSIVSALGTAPILRLNRTWAQVNPKTNATLESMRQLMASTKNFGQYREKLHAANPPCIPFLGTALFSMVIVKGTQLTASRCILDRSDIHRGRHCIRCQEHGAHQLRQTSKDRRSHSRHPAVSERPILAQPSAGPARVDIGQHEASHRRA